MPTSPTTRVIEHLRRAVLREGAGLGDGELLGRFLERHDEAALAALVKRHGPMVWGVCRRMLSHHDAEDAFQATFLVLVRKAPSVVPRELVGNWLYGVAHQTALQARRTAARRKAREVQVTAMPDTEAVRQDQWLDVKPLLDQELSRLPDIYRAVIVLCDLEGRTRKEVARQLGVPEGTVAGRLARARAMLAKRLTARGVTLSRGALAAVLARNVASASVPDAVVSNTIRAASFFAAGQAAAISGQAVALTDGVLKAMMMSKLKAALAVVVFLGLIATGVTALSGHTTAAHHDQSPAAEAPAKSSEAPSQKPETRDKLKQIGSAMQSYLDTYKIYPGPALSSKAGKPLLSWRVALLPHLNEGDLYKQFRLDEPWDSAHNKRLLARMPAVYHRTGAKDDTATPFQVFVGKGTMFEGPIGLGYRDIPDGTSNTIAVVEAADAVPWTKPEDLPYSATGKLPELGGEFPDVTYVLFADGNVHALKRRFDSDALRLAITRDDGIQTPWDKLRAPAPRVGDQEKEGFTAWGKEVGGLQAGLGFRPGAKRAYSHGETVPLVVRVRNISEKEISLKYISAYFFDWPPSVTDGKGMAVPPIRVPGQGGDYNAVEVNLAPGKEIELAELKLELRPESESGKKSLKTLYGTGKFLLHYERVMYSSGKYDIGSILARLATGKLELEVKEPDKQPNKEAKEPFTAWGKEVSGLQAGLGFRPGAKRAYSHGETVPLVVRVRNVSKEDVRFEYIKEFIRAFPPAVTDAKGKPIFQRGDSISGRTGSRAEVNLAPGKEIELGESKLELGPEFGTGKVQIRYERVFPPSKEDRSGSSRVGLINLDPTGGKLATGKLEVEVKSDPPRVSDKSITIRVVIDKVNADSRAITASCVALGVIDGERKPLRLENLSVSKFAKIKINGKEASLADLKPGTGARLELDGRETTLTVIGIEVIGDPSPPGATEKK